MLDFNSILWQQNIDKNIETKIADGIRKVTNWKYNALREFESYFTIRQNYKIISGRM